MLSFKFHVHDQWKDESCKVTTDFKVSFELYRLKMWPHTWLDCCLQEPRHLQLLADLEESSIFYLIAGKKQYNAPNDHGMCIKVLPWAGAGNHAEDSSAHCLVADPFASNRRSFNTGFTVCLGLGGFWIVHALGSTQWTW